eukprot:gene2711-1696_t
MLGASSVLNFDILISGFGALTEVCCNHYLTLMSVGLLAPGSNLFSALLSRVLSGLWCVLFAGFYEFTWLMFVLEVHGGLVLVCDGLTLSCLPDLLRRLRCSAMCGRVAGGGVVFSFVFVALFECSAEICFLGAVLYELIAKFVQDGGEPFRTLWLDFVPCNLNLVAGVGVCFECYFVCYPMDCICAFYGLEHWANASCIYRGMSAGDLLLVWAFITELVGLQGWFGLPSWWGAVLLFCLVGLSGHVPDCGWGWAFGLLPFNFARVGRGDFLVGVPLDLRFDVFGRGGDFGPIFCWPVGVWTLVVGVPLSLRFGVAARASVSVLWAAFLLVSGDYFALDLLLPDVGVSCGLVWDRIFVAGVPRSLRFTAVAERVAYCIYSSQEGVWGEHVVLGMMGYFVSLALLVVGDSLGGFECLTGFGLRKCVFIVVYATYFVFASSGKQLVVLLG